MWNVSLANTELLLEFFITQVHIYVDYTALITLMQFVINLKFCVYIQMTYDQFNGVATT
jgi:hypothetical protein